MAQRHPVTHERLRRKDSSLVLVVGGMVETKKEESPLLPGASVVVLAANAYSAGHAAEAIPVADSTGLAETADSSDLVVAESLESSALEPQTRQDIYIHCLQVALVLGNMASCTTSQRGHALHRSLRMSAWDALLPTWMVASVVIHQNNEFSEL